MNIPKEIKIDLYRQMLRIRLVEETIADHYPKQKMRTPVHLSIGQEAVAVAAGNVLRKTDCMVGTHRSHAHYLGKGGSLKAMLAEIHGKVTGCCRGRGGSMHLIDTSVGFMGSTAIVGNTIPIGVGMGLSIKLAKDDGVSCIFLGDGAVEEGVFYESLNFAVLKKLPVIFICENNGYSVYSPLEKRQPSSRLIRDMAKSMGALIDYGDGNNVLECYQKISKAAHALREGSTPWFLEFDTYRWREHCGPNYDNHIGYRTVEEFEYWKTRDPLPQYKQYLLDHQLCNREIFQKIEQEIKQEIEEAFDFAETSAFPEPIEAVTGQYAGVSHG